MQIVYPVSLLVGLLSVSSLNAQSTAHAVVNYVPGINHSQSYTNLDAVIGSPSRVTPGEWGGPVDPFNAPYLNSQLLSMGTGGSLTMQLSEPIQNDPTHAFGFDFTVFGNSFFVITNGDYSGGGITDGTVYPASPSTTRVSISGDGALFFELTPSLAPSLNNFFPTDGQGRFDQPVDPSLKSSDFSNLDIVGIRRLYLGSGGGTSYDLGWARDPLGRPIADIDVNYIRIDVLNGRVEIDGISAVPEPSVLSLLSLSGILIAIGFNRKRSRGV